MNLSLDGAIRNGLRVRSYWVSAAGLVVFLGAAVATGTIVHRWYERLTPQTSPDWILQARVRWTNGPIQLEALNEIGRRVCVELRAAARTVIPAEYGVEVYVTDGTVYHWQVEIPTAIEPKEPDGVIGDWAAESKNNLDHLCGDTNRKLHALTRDAVVRRGHDPWFNPELDVTSSFKAAHFVAWWTGPDFRPSFSRGESPPTEEKGGRIDVEITPHHDEWKLGEAITGVVVMRNTGTTRVHVDSFRWEDLEATLTGADQSEYMSSSCCRLPMPGARLNRYLLPGESLVGTFRVSFDQRESASRTYKPEAGNWRLTYPTIDNLRVDATPATVRVVQVPGRMLLTGAKRYRSEPNRDSC